MSNTTSLLSSTFVVLSLALAHPLAAQSVSPTTNSTDGQRVASRLGIALVGIALGPQGNRFFFLPCTERGVIHYVYSGAGLQTRFEGCDLGDGVVVDGRGHLTWSGPGLEAEPSDRFCGFMVGPGLPTCPRKLHWNGLLEVRVDGASMPALSDIRIDELDITDRGGSFPEGLDFRSGVMGFDSMSVSLWDSAFPVTDRGLPHVVFAPSELTLATIPNPEGSPDTWTEADVARLAWDAVSLLARWLLDETLEVNRGPHTHDLGCGISEVAVVENLPVVHADWRNCEFRGLVWNGKFRLRWNEIGRHVLDLSLDGDLEIGGAVPQTTIDRLDWRSEEDYPRSLHLTGELESAGQRRSFEYQLGVND